jgi:hypothetical protein
MTRTPLALIAAIAAAAVGVATVQHTQAAATFAYFDPTNLGEGTLDGVGFTVTVDSNGGFNNTSTGNFNTAAYGFAGSQSFLDYYGTTVTITFDQAISDLNLYLYFFRGGTNPASGGTAGAEQYTFDQSFSINANFDGGTQNGNVLETPDAWANGVLSFSGAITSLSWTSSSDVLGQGFTFSGTANASAVPGAGLAGLATVGLAGASRRRRR